MTLKGDAVLTLEATGPEANSLVTKRLSFDARGGTIGRTENNSWVLPHQLVSSHHADITYANGAFFITDAGSTNGVFFGSLTNRLPIGHPTPVDPGQLIIIQPYRIQASVKAARPVPTVPGSSEAASSKLGPLELLGIESGQPPEREPQPLTLEPPGPLGEVIKLPDVQRQPPLIPTNYDVLKDKEKSGEFRPPLKDPFEPDSPVTGHETPRPQPGGSDLAHVLAGAGLPDAPVSPSLGRDLGAILQVVVAGVMDLLSARKEIKDEFRMQETRLGPRDNNSLKFSANVGDALHNLLVKRNAAYMGPVESFEEAFNDLRNHQLAILAAMRTAFESMLAEFGPERLRSQFEPQAKKRSLLGVRPEAEYWKLYEERAEGLARDPERSYRDLFGRRFVEAYQEQLDRLSTRSRRGRP